MIFRSFLLVLFATNIVGCAAKGPMYSESIEMREKQADKALVTVYRVGGTFQYAGRSVHLKLDNQDLGSVDNKGFNIFDVVPGQHTLSSDMWDAPGKCTIAVDIEPYKQYFFEVYPRADNLLSGMVAGVVGMAIESSGKECGGAFAIGPVSAETAKNQLQPLRMTQ